MRHTSKIEFYTSKSKPPRTKHTRKKYQSLHICGYLRATSRVNSQWGHPIKLAKHVYHGNFLGFTATNRNIIYRNSVSNQVERARHVVFDEAFYNRSTRPPYAEQLFNAPDKEVES